MAQQLGTPQNSHRKRRLLGKGAGGACGLTELERWATALICSSSSKMRSSSSSVRCPGLQAWEDQEAKDELWARGQGQGPLHP